MPAITRVGDLSTGHDDCSAVPAVTGASNVLVNGQPVVCVGDSYASHGCIHHPSHAGQLIEGAPSFFINGKAVGRVGDAISCGQKVAEGASFCIVGNGNEQKLNKAIAERNEKVTKYIRSREDDIFYCLPRIAEAMAEKESNKDDKKGWLYLRDMFYKWLAGNANADPKKNPDPFWVDIDWVLSFRNAKEKWNEAIKEKILNEKGYNEIKKQLKELGYIKEKRTDFDFINIPYDEWDKKHYQHIAINYDLDGILSQVLFKYTGLFIALADFTFKFLAKGKINYLDNDFTIEIEQVAGFVYDIFNFEGDAKLGYWSCKDKKFSNVPKFDISISNVKFLDDSYVFLDNSMFRNFQYNNKLGNNFIILSNKKYIDIIKNEE